MRHRQRRAIIIVVDQLRADYIRADLTPELFRIFNLDSTSQVDWDVSYIPTLTETCHATLATAVTPGIHGIIGDGYFDRMAGRYELYEEHYIDWYYNALPLLASVASARGHGFKVFTVAGKDIVVDLLASPDIYLKIKVVRLRDYYQVETRALPRVKIEFERRITLDRISAADGRTPALDELVSGLATSAIEMVAKEQKWLGLVGLSALDSVGHDYGPRSDEPHVARAIQVADQEIGHIWRAAMTALDCDPVTTAESAPVLLAVMGDHGCRLVSHAIIPSLIGSVWQRLDLWLVHPPGQVSRRTGDLFIPNRISSFIRHAECDGGTIRLWLHDRGDTEAVLEWIRTATFSNGAHLSQFISQLSGTQQPLPSWLEPSCHDNFGDIVIVAAENCAFFKPRWIDDLLREVGEGQLPAGEHGTQFPCDRFVPCLLSRRTPLLASGHDQLSAEIRRILGLMT